MWILQQIFISCSQMNDDNSHALYLSGVECVLSWMKIGQFPIDIVGQLYPHLLIAATRYLPNRYTYIHSISLKSQMNNNFDVRREDMDDYATRGWEVVQDCLKMVVTHAELYKRPQLFWEWSKTLICIVKEHGAKYYYELLTALGEAHSRTILLALASDDPSREQHKWTSQQITEFLLQCSEQDGRYPVDEKSSCIPFGFWYALQDDLTTLDESEMEKQAVVALKPIYMRLARALLKKATLPSSPSEAGTPDERELLRCYRYEKSLEVACF